MAVPTTGQPVLILKEGSTETRGKQAQKNNIMAAKLVSELIKSSLGPRGMDKMLVETTGDVTITNDGATILKEVDVQHPAAKMMVEIAKTTDNEVGDGTTSAVVLAGALLTKAEELVSKDVHPTTIVDGYSAAAEKAVEIINQIAIKVKPDDREWLERISTTSMITKLVSDEAPALSKLVVEALTAVAEQREDAYKVDLDNVKVEKKAGASVSETKLVRGMVLDKEVVHAAMPKRVEKGRIALVNSPFEIEKTEFSAEIRIQDPTQMKAFLDEENRLLKGMVDKIAQLGVNVLLCQKGIDDVAQHYLSKEGILAVRRVKEGDMGKLAKATGARVVTNLDDLASSDLGSADLVEERKIEEDKWVFIEGCKNPKAVSILVRGGSQRVVDEAERSLHDALSVVKDVMEKPAVVAGGGSVESHVYHELTKWSNTLSGREQLAAQKFAEAVEVIPLTLAGNAGLDPIDTQVELRARHGQGETWTGVNVTKGGVADLYESGVFEPVSVKEQIIKSATEAATMILRIDDVIASSKMRETPKAPGPPMGY